MRKSPLKALVVLPIILFSLSACQSPSPSAPPPAETHAPSQTPSPTAQMPSAGYPQETPSRTLTLAIGGESSEGYDPTLGWGRYGSPLFQSTLLRRNADLKIVNDLAINYTVSEDRLVWTVDIRSDVKFSDGRPLTARDVAFTYNQAAKSAGLTDLSMLDQAIAVDEDTVELRLKQPTSTFVNRLITLGIVPEHAYGEGYGRNPIGSGPYQLVQWDEGQQLIVEPNPHYYGEKPQFDRVVFLFTSEDAGFAAAKAGQVHVVSVPQALGKQTLEGMRVLPVPSIDNRGIMFPFVPDMGEKTEKGYPIGNNVTADLAIRRAINYAIDRQALVEGVLEGFGAPAYGPADYVPWWEPESAIRDNDPRTAQRILSEGGWQDTDGDGVLEKGDLEARFTLVYPASDSTRQSLALAVADMVRPIGIQIELRGASWDEIETLMHSNAVLFGWGSHDQTEMYNLYHSSMRGKGWYNTGFYANEQVDNYLDLAMGAPTEEEALVYWRAAQWDKKGVGFTTKGDAAWAWLVNLQHVYFVSDCLDVGKQQIQPHGHGWPITFNITEWRWICQ
ncbi:MAG: ABC transporter substrate-binding protein [Anaerolineales bacterium]|nr:ABC transporter substrate-binding protein [Anaerolineales bacterium]MDW8446643.1 ABC transporter substrate-binding protein [Anaerolineales bacterium]